jgi:hypothetical protein
MLERRRYPRFAVQLPFRLKIVGAKVETEAMILLAKDVSKTGLCFFARHSIEPGRSIEAEVILLGHGPERSDVHITGAGHIVRVEEPDRFGWYRLAATFDEISSSDQPGWSRLAAAFDDPSSSSKSQ